MSVAETPVGAYLKDLASSKAVPGGGSAAAGGAAMGSALLSMVSKISARKVAAQDQKQELEKLVSALDRMTDELARLSQDDVDAYRAVLEARTSAPGAPGRDELISQSVERAARVPLQTARLAGEGLRIEQALRPLAWEMLLSDLDTGHHLLVTGLRGALANVSANLPDVQGKAKLEIERDYRVLTDRLGRT